MGGFLDIRSAPAVAEAAGVDLRAVARESVQALTDTDLSVLADVRRLFATHPRAARAVAALTVLEDVDRAAAREITALLERRIRGI